MDDKRHMLLFSAISLLGVLMGWFVFLGLFLGCAGLAQLYIDSKVNEIYRGSTSYSSVGSTPDDARIDGATDAERTAILGALSSIHYPLDYASIRISVVDNIPEGIKQTLGEGSFVGQYNPKESRIYLKRELLAQSISGNSAGLSSALAHEIGHQLDFFYLRQEDRARIMSIRGFTGLKWQSAEQEWSRQPNEDFSESFALYSTGATSGRIFEGDRRPSDEQLRKMMGILGSRALVGTPVDPAILDRNQKFVTAKVASEQVEEIISDRRIILAVLLLILISVVWRTREAVRRERFRIEHGQP